MFVHSLEAKWTDHPFWRQRFLIRNQRELDKLHDAGIDHVLIDDTRGHGPPAPAVDVPSPQPEPALSERELAQQIVAQSAQTMRSVFDGARLGKAIESEKVRFVVDQISGSVGRNAHALIGIVRLKSKDEYTYLHSVAVCALMVNLARHLGLDEATQSDLGMAGLVHDIGKMAVPSEILNKPGRLDDEEFDVIRKHPERGVRLLDRVAGMPDLALDVCHHHHEKVDGTGYPFGLKGEQISLAARMGAICDVYDALTSNRAYKDGWSPAEAVAAMHGWTGQFDPVILFAFFQSIGVYPAGLLVRMRSGHLGVVLPNGRRASRPRVRLFYDPAGETLIRPRDVVVADESMALMIAAEEDPANWPVADWPALRDHLMLELDRVRSETVMALWWGAPDDALPDPAAELVNKWRPGIHLS